MTIDPGPAVEKYAIDPLSGETFCSMLTRKSERADRDTTSYRVTFPNILELIGVVRRGNTVNWFCDLEQDRVMIADPQKPWEDKDRFHWVGSSTVDGGKVTTIPIEFFTGGVLNIDRHLEIKYPELADRDERPFWMRALHLYYAVSPWDCLADDAVFLIPIQDYIDLFDTAAKEAGMDGGRNLAERFVDEKTLWEEHKLTIDKCLENAKKEPDYWPDSEDEDSVDEPDDEPIEHVGTADETVANGVGEREEDDLDDA